MRPRGSGFSLDALAEAERRDTRSANVHSAVSWNKQMRTRGPLDHQEVRELKKQRERDQYLADRERLYEEAQASRAIKPLKSAATPPYLQADRVAGPQQPNEWLTATQVAYRELEAYGPSAQPVAAGGYRKPQVGPLPPAPPDQLYDVHDERDRQRQQARIEFAQQAEERATRNWRSKIVLGDDSTAMRQQNPTAMYQTSSSASSIAMVSTHKDVLRRAEEAIAVKELVEQFGYTGVLPALDPNTPLLRLSHALSLPCHSLTLRSRD